MKVPLLVAHRGWARRYPENTLAALQAALEIGACYIEFDVQLTADRVPVLLHDADLRRTAGRNERIVGLPLASVATLDVGQREIFGDRFADLTVPTLMQAVELVQQWPRARAFVEIKPDSIEHFGIGGVLDAISAGLATAPRQLVLISSVEDFLLAARGAGHREVGLVLGEWSDAARAKAEGLGPDYLFCNLKRIPPQGPLWSGPWSWVVYEVVNPGLALELAARGVDFIETMAIGEMLADPRLASESCLD